MLTSRQNIYVWTYNWSSQLTAIIRRILTFFAYFSDVNTANVGRYRKPYFCHYANYLLYINPDILSFVTLCAEYNTAMMKIRLFNDASISKMICVKTPDMYTVYIIAKDMIVVNIWYTIRPKHLILVSL